MKANEYRLIERCVEEGSLYGWRRAHKHTEAPDKERILAEVRDGIMLEISEYFDFNDETDTGATGAA